MCVGGWGGSYFETIPREHCTVAMISVITVSPSVSGFNAVAALCIGVPVSLKLINK